MLMTPRSLARSVGAGQHLGDEREVDRGVDAVARRPARPRRRAPPPGLRRRRAPASATPEIPGPDHEDLAPADPVAPEAEHHGGHHRRDGVQRGQHEHPVVGLVVAEAEPVGEVVEQVEGPRQLPRLTRNRVIQAQAKSGCWRGETQNDRSERAPVERRRPWSARAAGGRASRGRRGGSSTTQRDRRWRGSPAAMLPVALGDADAADDADGLRDREHPADQPAARRPAPGRGWWR